MTSSNIAADTVNFAWLLTITNATAVVTNLHAVTKCASSNNFFCQLCCLFRHCRSDTTIAAAAATAAAAAAAAAAVSAAASAVVMVLLLAPLPLRCGHNWYPARGQVEGYSGEPLMIFCVMLPMVTSMEMRPCFSSTRSFFLLLCLLFQLSLILLSCFVVLDLLSCSRLCYNGNASFDLKLNLAFLFYVNI